MGENEQTDRSAVDGFQEEIAKQHEDFRETVVEDLADSSETASEPADNSGQD